MQEKTSISPCKNVFLNDDPEKRKAAYTKKWIHLIQRMVSPSYQGCTH